MRVMNLSQALRASSGAVALILGSAVIAMAQPPSPKAKTAEDRAIITTEPSSGFLTAEGKATRVAMEPLLAAHIRTLDRVVGLPLTRRPANSATIDHAFASLPLPTRWSRDMAVASLQASLEAVAAPSFSSTLEHEEVRSFRVRSLPYPDGVFPRPPIPGQPQTPTTQAQQYGYELFRWQP